MAMQASGGEAHDGPAGMLPTGYTTIKARPLDVTIQLVKSCLEWISVPELLASGGHCHGATK